MRSIWLILLFFVAIILPSFVEASTGQCLLEVNKKKYIDGRCEIDFNDEQGSFTVGVGDKKRLKYFAYVNKEDDGMHGYWNETPDSNHAHTSLGVLKRHGACWENNTARVCAYR